MNSIKEINRDIKFFSDRYKFLNDLYQEKGPAYFDAEALLNESTSEEWCHPWLAAFLLKRRLLPPYQIYKQIGDKIKPHPSTMMRGLPEFLYRISDLYEIDFKQEGLTSEHIKQSPPLHPAFQKYARVLARQEQQELYQNARVMYYALSFARQNQYTKGSCGALIQALDMGL